MWGSQVRSGVLIRMRWHTSLTARFHAGAGGACRSSTQRGAELCASSSTPLQMLGSGCDQTHRPARRLRLPCDCAMPPPSPSPCQQRRVSVCNALLRWSREPTAELYVDKRACGLQKPTQTGESKRRLSSAAAGNHSDTPIAFRCATTTTHALAPPFLCHSPSNQPQFALRCNSFSSLFPCPSHQHAHRIRYRDLDPDLP
jgi:hypothetical protein